MIALLKYEGTVTLSVGTSSPGLIACLSAKDRNQGSASIVEMDELPVDVDDRYRALIDAEFDGEGEKAFLSCVVIDAALECRFEFELTESVKMTLA